MKLNAGKRILMFFHWLFSLLICGSFAAYIIRRDWTMSLFNRVTGGLSSTHLAIIGIAILAIYVILTVVQACIIFQRGKRADRGFITVDSSDSGRVRIAVSAIEQMVRQSVISIDGITEMKIDIDSQDDAIAINISATLLSGSHVPTITVNMQRAIRQFVEMNCGVAVRSVSISINAVSAAIEGGKRWGRRKDDIKPPEGFAPLYAPPEPEANRPVEPAEPEVAPEPVAETPVFEDTAPEETSTDAASEDASETVFIPDPEPIRLHFDHIPEQPAEPSTGDLEAPETLDDEA